MGASCHPCLRINGDTILLGFTNMHERYELWVRHSQTLSLSYLRNPRIKRIKGFFVTVRAGTAYRCHEIDYLPSWRIRGDTLFLSPSIPHLVKSQPMDKKLQA